MQVALHNGRLVDQRLHCNQHGSPSRQHTPAATACDPFRTAARKHCQQPEIHGFAAQLYEFHHELKQLAYTYDVGWERAGAQHQRLDRV